MRSVKRTTGQFFCHDLFRFVVRIRRSFFAAETCHKVRIIPYKRVNRAARYVTLISCGYARHNFVNRLVLFDRIFDQTQLRYYYVVLFRVLRPSYRNPLMRPTTTNGAKIHFYAFRRDFSTLHSGTTVLITIRRVKTIRKSRIIRLLFVALRGII